MVKFCKMIRLYNSGDYCATYNKDGDVFRCERVRHFDNAVFFYKTNDYSVFDNVYVTKSAYNDEYITGITIHNFSSGLEFKCIVDSIIFNKADDPYYEMIKIAKRCLVEAKKGERAKYIKEL